MIDEKLGIYAAHKSCGIDGIEKGTTQLSIFDMVSGKIP